MQFYILIVLYDLNKHIYGIYFQRFIKFQTNFNQISKILFLANFKINL